MITWTRHGSSVATIRVRNMNGFMVALDLLRAPIKKNCFEFLDTRGENFDSQVLTFKMSGRGASLKM